MSDHHHAELARFAKSWGATKATLHQTGRVVWTFDVEDLEKLRHFLLEKDELIRELLEREYEHQWEQVG